jgi:hypothetical protein
MALMDDSRRARYEKESGANTTFVRIPFFKVGQGTTKIRVMPGQEPGSVDKDFFVLVYMHYKVSPTKPTVPVVCAKTKDPRNRCIICDYVKTLRDSEDAGDRQLAEDMGQRMKYAMGVVPLEGEDKGKQMVFMAPKVIWSKIIALGGDSEYGDVTNPYEGFDLRIKKEGSGKKGTNYDCTPVRNPSPIAETPEEIQKMLDEQFDLWRFKVIPSADEITGFMNGDIDRFTTDGFTIHGESAPKAAKAVEEDVEEEEEAEEPAIKTGRIPSSAAPNKAAKPSVEEEEEEEEEPAPRRPAPPVTPAGTKAKSNLDSIRSKLSGV